MAGLLKSGRVDDAARVRHDRHDARAVIAVIAAVALYAYLLTPLASGIGAPSPRSIAKWIGLSTSHFFAADGSVKSALAITLTHRLDAGVERLVLLATALVAFAGAYFAPIAKKHLALVVSAIASLAVLYGLLTTLTLLAAHVVVFVALVPKTRIRAAGFARRVVTETALLTVLASALARSLGSGPFSIPLGLLLFFWQWERLILFRVDYEDGRLPKDLSLTRYLAIFLCPAGLANWNWGVTIGQGYAYTAEGHLAEDKNALVFSGLRLWAIGLFYLVASEPLRAAADAFFRHHGVPVFGARTSAMVAHFARGGAVSQASVLLTTMLDLARWLMLWGGVVHFKVGLWRILGYRMDPYFDKPWAATNLVGFWARFTFHYREFLARAFYYPTFFRCFKKHPRLRVAFATLISTGVGNLVWGHVTEGAFYHGASTVSLVAVLRTWPYFLALATGVAVTEVALLFRKRRAPRAPWTPGPRLALDVLCAYATLQFYALIIIFARPTADSTLTDAVRLFLRAFGL